MHMTPAQHREMAEALFEAEETRVWTQPLTLRYEDADIEDAYAVGQLVTDIKVAHGRIVKGHKVGLRISAGHR